MSASTSHLLRSTRHLSGPSLAPMANSVPIPPPGFDDLSVDEKIDYVESLWDRIAATPETVPVPDWHREIIDERLTDLEANLDAGDTWEVVQERLRKKLDRTLPIAARPGRSIIFSPTGTGFRSSRR